METDNFHKFISMATDKKQSEKICEIKVKRKNNRKQNECWFITV